MVDIARTARIAIAARKTSAGVFVGRSLVDSEMPNRKIAAIAARLAQNVHEVDPKWLTREPFAWVDFATDGKASALFFLSMVVRGRRTVCLTLEFCAMS